MTTSQQIIPSGIELERIYLRRLNWKTNNQAIRAPALAQPHLNVQLDVQHSPLPRNAYLLEVTLFLNASCDNAGESVFSAKIQFTGIFRLTRPEMASEPLVVDFCAAQIYPHLRREFANRTLLGGFQGLLLHDRHLETCLQRIFMGAKEPRAGFCRIFGTVFGQRSQSIGTAKSRNPTSTRIRASSRRALRSPWLLPLLAIPIVSSLLGGIHWWLDHRVPPTTTTASGVSTAPQTIQPDLIRREEEAITARLNQLAETGAAWKAAMPADRFTVIISRATTAEAAVEVANAITLDQPAFLLRSPNASVVISGVYEQKKDATALVAKIIKLQRNNPLFVGTVVRLDTLKTD